MHVLNPMRVVVTPQPLLKEQIHVPSTIRGRLLVIVPANMRISARPNVRFVYVITVIQ